MAYTILAINPGSTSTKLAVFEDEQKIVSGTVEHPLEELEQFANIQEQFEMRKDAVLAFLTEHNVALNTLSAVVGRGGLLPPVKSGAYRVNEAMLHRLRYHPLRAHASNLGALIAEEIANPLGIPAFIYDSIAVDELDDIARISGMPVIQRESFTHALNSRAMAIKTAQKFGRPYQEMNFVVAHLGGGISISAHQHGRMLDIVSDDEGPFSPERAGRVPCKRLIDLCYSGEYDKAAMHKMLRGNGGLKAYLGTHDAREVTRRIDAGDEQARLIFEAMALQIAKSIGEMAVVLEGEVDAIVLTGGLSYSERLTEAIARRVRFIAPVEILAGEYELESLSGGALRVLRGDEEAREYTE